jgi:tRNA dimethylallyltransferase
MSAFVVVIAGATASGKSSLAMKLADRLGGELINADSVQVYRGFDIGTAKCTAAERTSVPHHLIDTRDPHERWSAADFAREADDAIADIGSRGRLPIIVGGTGLYVRSLLHGLVDVPGADAETRARLEAETDAIGLPAMYERLATLDAATAARLHPNDRMRIIRALEVVSLTGRAFSEAQAEHGHLPDRYRYFGVALFEPRDWIYRRIDSRAAAMIANGLVDEVNALRAAGVSDDAPAFGSLGYRQVLEMLRGELDATELVERIARDTRHYAKRQATWFRKERGFEALDAKPLAEAPAAVDALVGRVLAAAAAAR